MAKWRWVTSSKPRRAGEVFLQRDHRFVLKIYRDAPLPDVKAFAQYLVNQLNRLEDEKSRNEQTSQD